MCTQSRRILKQHPELLRREANALLGHLLERRQDDARATRILTEHRDLLYRCREEGIEGAFTNLSDADPEALLRELLERAESDLEARAIPEAMHDQARQHPLMQTIQALNTVLSPAEVREQDTGSTARMFAEASLCLGQMDEREGAGNGVETDDGDAGALYTPHHQSGLVPPKRSVRISWELKPSSTRSPATASTKGVGPQI